MMAILMLGLAISEYAPEEEDDSRFTFPALAIPAS
jgi:hypothetical protein